MSQDLAEPMWLKHPRTGVVWLVTHADTQQRCLADGYTLAPDPRLPQPESGRPEQPEPTPEPVIAPHDEADAEAQAAIQAATVAQIQDRNDAARKWAGLQPAPRPATGGRKGVKRATI